MHDIVVYKVANSNILELLYILIALQLLEILCKTQQIIMKCQNSMKLNGNCLIRICSLCEAP